ncbi:hypothetical protein OE88DRAFT_1732236 [Heliocybe sulcata]|uniref:U4/U6.U5 small nuclear ribonucleoprotein 27kDa protein domain-containing protein n=1 Tax=Heliocybe sulcata TaxID=5364 RepID=A0A5C3NAV3_9AGAM|nr:hypothetical protein OE88DRAFT_1732236 [Heliocybe sulcata]
MSSRYDHRRRDVSRERTGAVVNIGTRGEDTVVPEVLRAEARGIVEEMVGSTTETGEMTEETEVRETSVVGTTRGTNAIDPAVWMQEKEMTEKETLIEKHGPVSKSEDSRAETPGEPRAGQSNDSANGMEEGEAMDATNDDDAAMMAMMGLSGFGTTKGKHVEGNQEGSIDVKKMRTWRQYMNRRGGFNRPLDKIK